MLNVAIKNVEIYSLSLRSSFVTENKTDFHLDFPMTANAFMFRCIPNTIRIALLNTTTKKNLFKFYAMHSMPQYEVCRIKKIYVVKECEVFEVDGCMNFKFTKQRGSNSEEYVFSFSDHPLMNPYDWICLFNILSKEETKSELSYCIWNEC